MATEPVLPDRERAEPPPAGINIPLMPLVSPSGRASGIWHPRLPGRKPKLVRGSGLTVHGQIEDWLADAIATGRLAPGDRLPTEQDLAEWLGVSRMTLRHALAELGQRGLVTTSVGRTRRTFGADTKGQQGLTALS